MRPQVFLGIAASFVASASAHATWQELWIGSVDAGSSCVRQPASNSPITDITSTNLACNIAGTSSGVCPVNAGETITIEMHQQPGDRSCADEAIGGDHYGPINIYMAAVSDATTAVGSSAAWFKIAESGMPSNNPDYWATEVLNNNCGHWTFTIPSDIAPGNYLLRAEVIALHVASTVGGAQFYPGCFQLNVAGTGTAKPPTVQIPGVYSASDPGILINIYQTLATYAIPGPTPYGTTVPTIANTAYPTTATWNTAQQPSTVPTVVPGAPTGTGVTTTVKPTTTTPTTITPTPTTTVKTTTTPTTTPVTGGAALYGQCGGIGWTGATTCAQGTCQVSNQYYSQCLN
ncbi:glycosyl hydrolase family 61-domain-containing protein [Pholiota molesta]|nr:glycosyl hydrolase family 61-domain-containing protein [Pholiota molesta]